MYKYKSLREKEGYRTPAISFFGSAFQRAPYTSQSRSKIPRAGRHRNRSPHSGRAVKEGSTRPGIKYTVKPMMSLPGESRALLKPKRRISELKRFSSYNDLYRPPHSRKPYIPETGRIGSPSFPRGTKSEGGSSGSSLASELDDERIKQKFDNFEVADSKRLVYHESGSPSTPASPEIIINDNIFSYDSKPHLLPKRVSGLLYFSLFYDSFATQLTLTIQRATDLPRSEKQAVLSPYVKFCVIPKDFFWQQTTVKESTTNPVFNQSFHIKDVLHHKLRQYSICFLVMDSRKTQGEGVIGKVMVPLSDLAANVAIEMCKEISRA